MSESELRIHDYLAHILQAMRRIGRYTQGISDLEFFGDELVQDAVIRNIEILGEAARNISRKHPDFASAHPDIPWEDIYLMRNRVAHGYFSVDLEIVWRTLQRDLPELERLVQKLQDSLED